MPEARVSAEIPEGVWIHDVSREHPELVFRVVSAVAGDGKGVGVVEIEGEGYQDAIDDTARHDRILKLETLWENAAEDEALIQIETDRPVLLEGATKSGIPVRTPFEINNGVGRWELTASRKTISDFASVFEAVGVDYDIEYVGDIEGKSSLLTDKQMELIQEAYEMGYYDTPREASLSEVADKVGMAKSTCSEILHRAEERIVTEFLKS